MRRGKGYQVCSRSCVQDGSSGYVLITSAFHKVHVRMMSLLFSDISGAAQRSKCTVAAGFTMRCLTQQSSLAAAHRMTQSEPLHWHYYRRSLSSPGPRQCLVDDGSPMFNGITRCLSFLVSFASKIDNLIISIEDHLPHCWKAWRASGPVSRSSLLWLLRGYHARLFDESKRRSRIPPRARRFKDITLLWTTVTVCYPRLRQETKCRATAQEASI